MSNPYVLVGVTATGVAIIGNLVGHFVEYQIQEMLTNETAPISYHEIDDTNQEI